jgi:hypothetical protein
MCCFLFADEAVAPQDKKAEGVLKRLITDHTLTIEPKGVDPFEEPNFLHVMMASNHDWAIMAGEKERRYVAQKVDEKHQQSEEYFAPIYREMSNGGLGAMLFHLLEHDLGDWRPRMIVRTKALAQQQEESLSPLDQWMLGLLQTGVLPGHPIGAEPNEAVSESYEEKIEEEEVEETALYGKRTRTRKRTVMRPGLYDHARHSSPKLRTASYQALGRYLRDFGTKPPDIFLSTWVHRRRGWRFPSLSKCRDRWCERFPDTDWGGGPAEWTIGEDDED